MSFLPASTIDYHLTRNFDSGRNDRPTKPSSSVLAPKPVPAKKEKESTATRPEGETSERAAVPITVEGDFRTYHKTSSYKPYT